MPYEYIVIHVTCQTELMICGQRKRSSKNGCAFRHSGRLNIFIQTITCTTWSRHTDTWKWNNCQLSRKQHIKNIPTLLYNVTDTSMGTHISKLYHFRLLSTTLLDTGNGEKVLGNPAKITTKTTMSLMLAHQWYFTTIWRLPATLSIYVYITALQDTSCRKTLSD